MKKIILFGWLLAALVSCQQPAKDWSSMTIIQDKPQLTNVTLGDSLHRHGDGLAYEAILRDSAGTRVGDLLGWLITVAIEDGGGINAENMVEKIGTMVFNLGGDDVVALGGSLYPQGQKIMKEGQPQKRTLVGGTGKYRGITGEVHTTRISDSTYTHELIYRLPD